MGAESPAVHSEFLDAAAGLVGAPVTAIAAVRPGGNNRVYRATTPAGIFALKIYPPRREDLRDRLSTEFEALSFLARHQIANVPRPFGSNRSAGIAMFEWVVGSPVGSVTSNDLDAAATFSAQLKALSLSPEAASLPLASEASLSALELEVQVDRRFTRLAAVSHDADLTEFLQHTLRPLRDLTTAAAREGYRRRGWDFAADIPAALRTLSPSDFGFHNALRRSDRSIVFIDFEYFGWDDPVRLIADFMLHPGMGLSPTERHRFSDAAISSFSDDPNLPDRVGLLLPLIGLRWCLILLNEFLPERWARRVFAGAGDRDAAQAQQLQKSRQLAAEITIMMNG